MKENKKVKVAIRMKSHMIKQIDAAYPLHEISPTLKMIRKSRISRYPVRKKEESVISMITGSS